MRVRNGRVAAAGVVLAAAGAVTWLARARPALVRAALIRVAVLVEDVIRVGQIALLRVFHRSTTPLLIPFVGDGSPQRVELGARMLVIDDSVEIAEHTASLGLLDAAQGEDVRRETHPDGVVRGCLAGGHRPFARPGGSAGRTGARGRPEPTASAVTSAFSASPYDHRPP